MGAENPLKREGVGAALMLAKVKLCSGFVRWRTLLVSPSGPSGISSPSPSSRPMAMGIYAGALLVCPGVSGVRCDRVSVKLDFSAS